MRAIVTFQGFTESIRQRSGTEDLYFNVIRPLSNGEIVTYQPLPWTARVDYLAAQIARQGIRNVALISYSHGQAAACDFARLAYDLGISVDLWLACDPVYRPTWLPRIDAFQPLSFRALSANVRIRVPENIRRVVSVRQRLSLPGGHDLKPATPATVVEEPLVLRYAHTAIDSAPEWHNLVKEELSWWANPGKATPV